jgi:hypothetical protein
MNKKNLIDEDLIDIGIRRHTDDKLTYKLIIANAINECRISEGLIKEYPDSVLALINLLSFEITGYNLKSQIDKITDKLDKEKEKLWDVKKDETPRWIFYKKSYQAKFKLKLDRAYWETLFKEVLQILASEGLLMDTEKLVSVKTVGETEND